MEPNELLGADEEYVPGYETEGPVECIAQGTSPGIGYEAVAKPIAGCGAGPVSNFAWADMAQRRKRKKKARTICVPFTGTAEYALLATKFTPDYFDRGIGGCGQESKKIWGLPIWRLTGERCGPTSADPDCQG